MAQIEKQPKKAAPTPAPAGKATAAKGKGAAAAAAEEPEADPVQTALARYGIIMSMPWEPKKMCAPVSTAGCSLLDCSCLTGAVRFA